MVDGVRGERVRRDVQEVRCAPLCGSRVDGVDGDLGWRHVHVRPPSYEPLGVRLVCGIESLLPDPGKLRHPAEEDVGGSEKREAGVAMAVRVPLEELAHPAPRMPDAVERPG